MTNGKVQEDGGCEACKSVEKEIYWNHIKHLCFCVALPPDFHHNLKIPKKFAENMIPKMLLPKMTLRGPSGASWEVKLMITVDGLFLQHGWEEFVNAYSLEEKDILLFKYDRNSSFDVKIFNGECEKEAAYFVKKCGHMSFSGKYHKKRTSSEIVDEENEFSNPAKKVRKDDTINKKILRCRKSVQLAIHYLRKKATSKSLMELQGNDSLAGPEFTKQLDQIGSINKDVQNSPQVTKKFEYVYKRRAVIEREKKETAYIVSKCDFHVSNLAGPKPARKNDSINKETQSVDQNPREVVENSLPHVGLKKVSLVETRDKAKSRSLTEMQGRDSVAGHDENGSTNKEIASADQNPSELMEDSHVGVELAIAKEHDENRSINKAVTCVDQKSPEPTEDSHVGTLLVIANEPDQNGSIIKEEKPSVDQNPPEFTQNSLPNAGLENILFRSTPRKRFCTREKMKAPSVKYISNRRPVTVREKQAALRKAVLEVTDNSFFATIRSSYENFFMTIPNGFATAHLGHNNRVVILRVGENKWETEFNYIEGGLGTGWKRFALDNNLEESDVCLFKFVGQEDNQSVMFDVAIFRVVEDVVTPPTLLIT